MKFHVMTFGCQMNVNDSDWLKRALTRIGFEEAGADELDSTDVFIINTCSVREKPEQKVYSLLGRLKPYYDKNKNVFAVVGGCVAQQLGRVFFNRFPFVRLVFGADGTAMAPQAIERLCREPGLRLSLIDFTEDFPERPLHEQGLARQCSSGQAFVTIMQGCDNFCAYCIVPYTRGRQKSRPSGAVIRECEEMVRAGAREITLLGQNVNSYGLDKHGDGVSFAGLLDMAGKIPGLKRLRFTTSHPKDLADEVIERFGLMENLCPHLHLPLQSGSDKILKSMGRKYDLAGYLGLVERLKKARPEMTLSTDLIVGFPGESDKDFEQTLDALEKIGFVSSFSFQYSDRPGVRAEKMAHKIPREIKAERLARLQELQNHLSRRDLAAQVGREAEILVQGECKKQPRDQDQDIPCVRGRDPHGRIVNLTDPYGRGEAKPGAIVRALITEAKKHSLLGERKGDS